MRIKPVIQRATISEIIEQSQSLHEQSSLSRDDYKVKLRDHLSQRTLSVLETDELQHISDIIEVFEIITKQQYDMDERATLNELTKRKKGE